MPCRDIEGQIEADPGASTKPTTRATKRLIVAVGAD